MYLGRFRGSTSQLLPSLEDLRSKDLRSLRCRLVPPHLLKRQYDQFQSTATVVSVFLAVVDQEINGATPRESRVSWRPSSAGLSRHRAIFDQ